MVPAAGLVLALLTLAPVEAPEPPAGDEVDERDDGLVVIECFIPDEVDGELLRPEGYEVSWRRRTGPTQLIRMRTSFFEVLVAQAAGL